jgi:hypothetical protein
MFSEASLVQDHPGCEKVFGLLMLLCLLLSFFRMDDQPCMSVEVFEMVLGKLSDMEQNSCYFVVKCLPLSWGDVHVKLVAEFSRKSMLEAHEE